MSPTLFQFNLVQQIFGGSDPRYWECPIQEAIPFFISKALLLLQYAAAIVFLVMIIVGVYHYLTSFGDDNKVKQGKKTIQYAFVGAAIFILAFVITELVTYIFLSPNTNPASLEFPASDCHPVGRTLASPSPTQE